MPSASNPGFQYLVVGGGGAGGSGSPGPQGNVGGGGGGGVLNGTGEQLFLTAGTYTISVGGVVQICHLEITLSSRII